MLEEPVGHEMIEIGDPEADSPVPDPAPKVVIEYRERGIPWMLVPPILMLCVTGTILAYRHLGPASETVPSEVAVAALTTPQPGSTPPANPNTNPTNAQPSAPTEEPQAPLVEPEKPVPAIDLPSPVPTPAAAPANPAPKPAEPGKEAKTEVKPAPVDSAPPTPAPAPVPAPANPVAANAVAANEPALPEVPAVPEPKKAETPAPSVPVVGFDPKALEAEKAKPAPADGAVEPAKRAEAGDDKKPTEVPDDIMPPDPRKAMARQAAANQEMIDQVEQDRIRFHNDLREICRIQRKDYLVEVIELSNAYGMSVDPASKKKALFLFGPKGRYAGADRATRIKVLRAIGYPESLILEDLFDNFEKARIGERDGHRNASEAMHKAMLYLLNHAPGTKSSSSKPPGSNPPAAKPRS